jgi:hypothetical protein
MPRAYCDRCKKHVNAMPTGPSTLGAFLVDNPTGPIDMIVPVRNRFQRHYCPNCGASLVTEEQREAWKSDNGLLEGMFWIMTYIASFFGVASAVAHWNIPIIKYIPILAQNLLGQRWPLFFGMFIPTLYIPYVFYGSYPGRATLFILLIVGCFYIWFTNSPDSLTTTDGLAE